MFYHLVTVSLWSLLKLFFRFRVEGTEEIPRTGGCIVASNHVSYLDPVAVGTGAHFVRPLYYLAKQQLFEIPVFGRLLSALHSIPVKEGAEADLATLRRAIKLLESGKALVVFPEGGRSPNGRLQPGAPGVAFLAVRANVPVIPARVDGSRAALPPGARFVRLKPVRVCFGRRIDPSDLPEGTSRRERYRAMTNRIMEEIARLEKGGS